MLRRTAYAGKWLRSSSTAARALLAAAQLGMLGSASCGGDSSTDAGAERPLEVVVPTEIGSLDPRFTTRALDIKLTRLLHAGLAGLHPDTQEPVPLVAESWRWLGPMQLRVELRPGLKFHSGKLLEPRDVCETLRALADPSLASPHRVVAQAIGHCQEHSGAVVLKLRQARATLLSDLEVPILRADQARLPPQNRGELDGLGRFRVEGFDWSEVKLVGVPGAASASTRQPRRVVVRTVRDENARALRLIAGSADIAAGSVSPTLLPALAAQPGLEVRARQGANVTYMLFQNDLAPTNRREFRHAVGQAIDRQLLVDTLLAGKAQIASGVFPREHWSADPEAQPLVFSPEGARPELSGTAELTLATSTDRARLTIARAIAQMLEDAGANVRVVALDLGVLLRRLDSGDFQLAVLQMPELTEPNLLSWFFHPRGIAGEGGEGRNRARYRSAEVGGWLDQASATTLPEQRAQAYRQVARRMAHDLPVLPLWHEDQVAVVSPRAGDFELTAIGRWDSLESE